MNYFWFNWNNVFDHYIIMIKSVLIIFFSIVLFILFHISIFRSHKLHFLKYFWNYQGKQSGKFYFSILWFQCFLSVHPRHMNCTHNFFCLFITCIIIFFGLISVTVKPTYTSRIKYQKKVRGKHQKYDFFLTSFWPLWRSWTYIWNPLVSRY